MNYELVKKENDTNVSANKGTLEMTSGKMPARKTVTAIKDEFEQANSFEKAVGLIRDAGVAHGSYAHYTTLEVLDSLIKNRRWWLTRATSSEFDDLIESRKYGDEETLKNLFFVSFSYSQSESAAMWRLYSECDENAARLSLTKTALRDWLVAIKSKQDVKAYPVIGGEVQESLPITIEDAFVHDVIYASVEDDGGKHLRAKSLCWNDKFTKAVADLGRKRKSVMASGVLKDYEWRFEYESRLVVKVSDEPWIKDRIAVEIPENVFPRMKCTLSPWVQDEQAVRWRLSESMRLSRLRGEMAVTPSVLAGALEKWSKNKDCRLLIRLCVETFEGRRK